MNYSLIFLLLSLFCLSSYADSEEDERRRILEEYGSKDTIEKETQQKEPAKTQNNLDLEESIRKTVQDLQVVSKDNDSTSSDAQKIKGYRPRDLKDSYLTGVMDNVMKDMLKEFLKENPMSKMSEGEVRSLLEGRLNSIPGGNFFQNNPGALDFVVKWLRDERALPRLLSVVNEADRLKIYGIVVFCVFLFSFILNLFNSKGNLFKRILRKLMIIAGVTFTNFVVFYIMFKPNVQPTIDLLLQHLRG
jgi:hypothetical protein